MCRVYFLNNLFPFACLLAATDSEPDPAFTPAKKHQTVTALPFLLNLGSAAAPATSLRPWNEIPPGLGRPRRGEGRALGTAATGEAKIAAKMALELAAEATEEEPEQTTVQAIAAAAAWEWRRNVSGGSRGRLYRRDAGHNNKPFFQPWR